MIKPKVNHSKRTVGIQSIIQPKLYDSPKTLAQKNLETVEYSRLFYHSHTLIALFLGICILQVLIWYSKDWDLYDIQALAAKACILLILLFSSFYMPDTIVTRPHPFVWRMVLAANLIYAAFLVYLSFLPLDHARKTIKIFDSRLGDPLPAKSYAEDCRLYTPENPTSMFYNFSDKFYDDNFFLFIKLNIISDLKLILNGRF